MGYVKNLSGSEGQTLAQLIEGREFQIEINGVPFAARASLSPAYDPKSERVKM